jgi:RNA polymerase sigma-70 factor, ECF subfamily
VSNLNKISTHKEFQEVYLKFFNGLANYAFSILNNREAARDVVQDVFLDLWKKRLDLVIKTSLDAYLVRAVKFKSIDFIRKAKTQQQYVADVVTSVSESQYDFDENDEDSELKKKLSFAIAQLPPKCRQAFLLSRVNGYTYKEIAQEMQISVKTVENQISRAFKLLRQKLSGLMLVLFFFNFL